MIGRAIAEFAQAWRYFFSHSLTLFVFFSVHTQGGGDKKSVQEKCTNTFVTQQLYQTYLANRWAHKRLANSWQ